MSSEQAPITDSTTAEGDPVPTNPDPQTPEPPIDPDPGPTPDPIPPPTEPIVYQPYMWYSATWTCRTVGCVNENLEFDVPMLYSNNGTNVGVFCGRCNKKGLILTATLLDPQPEPE
ncbi:hypothetical protein [Streptomyces sp. NPDC059916]|uniref:hypothetical protein n=1 Tax=Streptomyces sp. NPDC059916 TaxID=3347001 RepID=UPI0036C96F07